MFVVVVQSNSEYIPMGVFGPFISKDAAKRFAHSIDEDSWDIGLTITNLYDEQEHFSTAMKQMVFRFPRY